MHQTAQFPSVVTPHIFLGLAVLSTIHPTPMGKGTPLTTLYINLAPHLLWTTLSAASSGVETNYNQNIKKS